MFRSSLRLLLAAVLFTAVVPVQAAPPADARDIVNNMLSSIGKIKTCKYTMRSLERIVGMKNLRGGDILTKINVSPQKTYLKMITDPNKDTELLYVKGERGDKVLVNPGKFLPTLKLSPFSPLVTKEQHHTMLSSGFSVTARIISDGVKRADAKGKFNEVFQYAGDVTWNNRACYKLIIQDPEYALTTYTAKEGERMYEVASKLLIPEYSLVELNGVKNFEESLAGKTLKVPNAYAKRTVMYIDKETNLPIYQEMTDDKGVFERYEFYNVQINPAFAADEFTEGFSGYNF